jgi:Domain of unknown function (DUF4282)
MRERVYLYLALVLIVRIHHFMKQLLSRYTHKPFVLNLHESQAWLREFMHALFDFSFSEVVTIKMLPLFYGLGIIATGSAALFVALETMTHSFWKGLLFLFTITPLGFIAGVAALRVTLEFVSAVFRLQSYMIRMNGSMKRLEEQMTKSSQHIGNVDANMTVLSQTIVNLDRNMETVRDVLGEIEILAEKIPFVNKTKRSQRARYWAESGLEETPPQKSRTFAATVEEK